jgi:hypothetical protein
MAGSPESLAGRKQLVKQVAEPGLEQVDLGLGYLHLAGPIIRDGPGGRILRCRPTDATGRRARIVVEVVGQSDLRRVFRIRDLRLRAMLGISHPTWAKRMAGVMPRYAAASISVTSGASSPPPCLTCVSSPRRAGDFRSRPSAGGAGRAISASLELTAPVRPTRHEQANKFSVGVCPVQGHGCGCGACAKPPSIGVGGGRALSRKRAQNSVLALGRLISFGFSRKRHQADSCDTPLTSTPTTTISATGGRAFLLPS